MRRARGDGRRGARACSTGRSTGHRRGGGATRTWREVERGAGARRRASATGSASRSPTGDWEAARELPPPHAAALATLALAPQERLAALLAGRDVALACEELALRARLDLDQGREREAALQLRAGARGRARRARGLARRGGMARRGSTSCAGTASAVAPRPRGRAPGRARSRSRPRRSRRRWSGSRRRCGRARGGAVTRVRPRSTRTWRGTCCRPSAGLERALLRARARPGCRPPTSRRSQGRLLELLARLAARASILEVGTLGGYSDAVAGPRAAAGRPARDARDRPAPRRGRAREPRPAPGSAARSRSWSGRRSRRCPASPARSTSSSSTPTRSAAPTTSRSRWRSRSRAR